MSDSSSEDEHDGSAFKITSSSEDEHDGSTFKNTWVLYRDREEWKDVVPVPQDDGPNPVVAIEYSELFTDCYSYFRAVLNSGEKSDRVLALTDHCINLNHANYTVWQYRRETLKALGKDLKQELTYVGNVLKRVRKGYQSWHHRMVIVEWLNDASGELEFTESLLKFDAKNYHAWQHRQWCIKTFNLYDNELEYLDKLLDEDLRNNSAWNQRYFIISHTTKFEQSVVDSEIDYTLDKLTRVKGNESAWNYLRGILKKDPSGEVFYNKVKPFCENLYDDFIRVNYLLAYIVETCLESPIDFVPITSIFHISNALKLCDDLSERHDTIRKRYWNYIRTQVVQKQEAELSKTL